MLKRKTKETIWAKLVHFYYEIDDIFGERYVKIFVMSSEIFKITRKNPSTRISNVFFLFFVYKINEIIQ